MFTMSFGSVEQAVAAARYLHRRHQSIRGTLPEAAGRFPTGTGYEANEIAALLWIFTTLVESAVIAYELVLPPLNAAEREQYYAESRRTAALFGIPIDCLPQDWSGFCEYMRSALQSDMLGVTAATREMAQRLQDGAGLKMRPPSWYRALTIALLPPRLREEFRFPFGEHERRSTARVLRWLQRIYPHLPAALRFVGPYNEVRDRRNGRRPGLAVRLSNRLWIGQNVLFDQPPRDDAIGAHSV
jgi:uncharacterized protein (DUF2236 family)